MNGSSGRFGILLDNGAPAVLPLLVRAYQFTHNLKVTSLSRIPLPVLCNGDCSADDIAPTIILLEYRQVDIRGCG